MTRGIGGHGPANIMKHLKHLHFPADKEKILSTAQRGPGPNTREIMDVLKRIPEKDYHSPAEIMQEIGKVA